MYKKFKRSTLLTSRIYYVKRYSMPDCRDARLFCLRHVFHKARSARDVAPTARDGTRDPKFPYISHLHAVRPFRKIVKSVSSGSDCNLRGGRSFWRPSLPLGRPERPGNTPGPSVSPRMWCGVACAPPGRHIPDNSRHIDRYRRRGSRR